MADRLTVWLDGVATPAGRLARTDEGEIGFTYARDYLDGGGPPLSLSLALREEPFGEAEARGFFANLLPENAQLQRVMDRQGLTRDDVVGLLRHFGADCAGAVSCLPVGDPPVKTPGVLATDYEVLEDRALIDIVSGLKTDRRLPATVRDPSPVAGVQGKIAVTRLPDGRFALPRAGLRTPSTHILKVPGKGHGRDVRHEEACALLARAARLDVSVPEPIRIGDVDALLIARFDRRVEDGVVNRIHQEDFAQALGLPSDLKYERNGRPGFRFDVAAILSVLDRTDDPQRSRFNFLRAVLLNLCLGNTDNHAKNFGLLYDGGGAPRLSPLYDMLPIRLDDRYTHELAFNIGRARYFDDLTRDDLTDVFERFGIAPEVIPDFLEAAVAPLIQALEAATPSFRGLGMKTFDDLIGRETERLVDLLGLDVAVRERDDFRPNGGGWQTGG